MFHICSLVGAVWGRFGVKVGQEEKDSTDVHHHFKSYICRHPGLLFIVKNEETPIARVSFHIYSLVGIAAVWGRFGAEVGPEKKDSADLHHHFKSYICRHPGLLFIVKKPQLRGYYSFLPSA